MEDTSIQTQTCAICGLNVVPAADGTCPGCGCELGTSSTAHTNYGGISFETRPGSIGCLPLLKWMIACVCGLFLLFGGFPASFAGVLIIACAVVLTAACVHIKKRGDVPLKLLPLLVGCLVLPCMAGSLSASVLLFIIAQSILHNSIGNLRNVVVKKLQQQRQPESEGGALANNDKIHGFKPESEPVPMPTHTPARVSYAEPESEQKPEPATKPDKHGHVYRRSYTVPADNRTSDKGHRTYRRTYPKPRY